MSIELVARAKKVKLGGDSTAKLLLIVLADYANDEGMAWPSVRTLTDEVEKQDRQIQRALRKLEDEGLIRLGDQRLTRNYPKGQRPTVYEVLPAPSRRHTRKRGVTHDTGTPVTHDTGTGGIQDTPTGDMHDTPTPVTHDTTPVTHMTPPRCHAGRGTGVTHDTQTVIETTNKPSRESTRATTEQPRPRSEAEYDQRVDRLLALTPDDTHRDLAARYGLDPDLELAKFVDRCRAEGKPPADPAAAFRNWLRRGHELGIQAKPATGSTTPAPAPTEARHTHTWKCDHVNRLLHREPLDATPDDLACNLAHQLNHGKTDTDALAAVGLDPDDLDQIA